MEIYISICLFLIGLVFGSFYLVVGSRMPIGESMVKERSHCEYCNHVLKWYELIPLISYIIQGGKCRSCKKKISIQYPACELATGLLFCSSYLLFDFSFKFYISLALFSLLIIIFVSDFKYFIILDSPLVISSIIIIITYLVFFGYKEAIVRVLFGLFIFFFLWFIKILGDKMFKRESLGGGDIKLGFVIGLVLGIPLGCTALVLSAFLALPYAITTIYLDEGKEVPFGPFMISATVIIFIYMTKFQILLDFLTF